MQQLASEENITRAIINAANERRNSEHAMFQSEMPSSEEAYHALIGELKFELQGECAYQPRYGYYYALPKSSLVDRYVVCLPFKELVIHYCFVQVIADVLDPQLSKHCFANRLERKENTGRLAESFAEVSWPNYCEWQDQSANDCSCMLVTDLSSFFDNIDRDLLLTSIARKMATSVTSPFFSYFEAVLSQPVFLFRKNGEDKLITRPRGIMTGPCCSPLLANYYLMDMDSRLNAIEGVEYGRYVDDIRLFGNCKQKLIEVFKKLQVELHALGLSINSSKTKTYNSNTEIVELIKQEVVLGCDYNGNEEIETIKDEISLLGDKLTLDLPFEQRVVEFDYKIGINDHSSAKQFCFFLSEHNVEDWEERDVSLLILIFKCYPSAIKHAAWLMVQAMRKGDGNVFSMAFHFVTRDLLVNENIHDYGKARVLHHFIKTRKRTEPYLYSIDGLIENEAFMTGVRDAIKYTSSTLLRIYALEVFYILVNKKASMTVSEFASACVNAGLRLNQIESKAILQLSEIELAETTVVE
ncbi:RNA-directed DNA polymerase [Enterovibrio paralichthyis]|uniref:RNA-directed DNA polymerase n=1 Tax=Enterovibrio paralichthyis TaxID=2853805 RepID=UPI001C446B25|nr:RNA-directed DNA polymerase [Enterovibrio paralichthyis]MBV7299362.1 RNA-directed DNA polymerase [Enterovibrio paralichthyis]